MGTPSVTRPIPTIALQDAGLSVVVPAYNEEQSVGQVVETLSAELARAGWPSEILVIDDGSTDQTAANARNAGARVLQHAANRGYGAALKTGIRHGKYGMVAILDADATYPLHRLHDLAARISAGGTDMVVGARTGANVTVPFWRRPAKWMLRRLAQAVAGQPIPDLNSGMRVMRRDAVLPFLGLLPDGFSFTTTITLAMLSNGYLVDYVPIDYHRRVGRSKIRPARDALAFLGLIVRIALYFAPLKVFLPLAGFMLALAAGWAITSKVVFGRLADVSTVVIAIGALQVGVLGLLAELINRRLPNQFHASNNDD